MQNGLDRLLGGLSHTLTEVLVPAIEDPYARAQAAAAADLIDNLVPRVTWRRDYLFGWIPRCRRAAEAALADAPEALPGAAAVLTLPEPSEDPAALEEYAAAHTALLAELIRWAPRAPEALRAEIDAVVVEQFAAERSRLRRGRAA